MPAIYVWLLVIFVITVVSVYSLQLAQRADDETGDAGTALLEFGKAFPKEAIREVMTTVDENAVFLRLSDGKVGCVQYHGRTMSCQLVRPGSASVEPGADENTIRIAFRNSRSDSGEFSFDSPRQAAEVSLWLLGSYAAESASGEGASGVPGTGAHNDVS